MGIWITPHSSRPSTRRYLTAGCSQPLDLAPPLAARRKNRCPGEKSYPRVQNPVHRKDDQGIQSGFWKVPFQPLAYGIKGADSAAKFPPPSRNGTTADPPEPVGSRQHDPQFEQRQRRPHGPEMHGHGCGVDRIFRQNERRKRRRSAAIAPGANTTVSPNADATH